MSEGLSERVRRITKAALREARAANRTSMLVKVTLNKPRPDHCLGKTPKGVCASILPVVGATLFQPCNEEFTENAGKDFLFTNYRSATDLR